MTLSYDLINGVSVGLEYLSADEEADIPYNSIILDLLIVRVLIEFE